jgi:hypothetical protein
VPFISRCIFYIEVCLLCHQRSAQFQYALVGFTGEGVRKNKHRHWLTSRKPRLRPGFFISERLPAISSAVTIRPSGNPAHDQGENVPGPARASVANRAVSEFVWQRLLKYAAGIMSNVRTCVGATSTVIRMTNASSFCLPFQDGAPFARASCCAGNLAIVRCEVCLLYHPRLAQFQYALVVFNGA